MGKEIYYKFNSETRLTAEQIHMIESAKDLPLAYDEENPPIDPEATPEQYSALMNAVAERNRRIAKRQKERA